MSLAFDRISIENLRDLSKMALTLSVFEVERCSFFLSNRSEFPQNSIIRVLVRNLRAHSEIGNHERDQQASVQSEPSVPPPRKNSENGLYSPLKIPKMVCTPIRN